MTGGGAEHNRDARTGTEVAPAVLPTGFTTVTVARFVTNVAYRLVFPFLPRIAAGLGVSLATMGTALALRDLTGAMNPALGRAADRSGHVRAMAFGMGLLAAALVLQGASSGLALFTVALVLVALAKATFDIASGAWVGESVPFRHRGRAIGLVETTWALSFVIGMPLAALVIRAGTWRTPFLVMGAIAVIAIPAVARLDRIGPQRREPAKLVLSSPVRFGVLAFAFLGVGHQILLVTFAAFLEDEHAVTVSSLGLTAVVLGLAELVGSGAAAGLSDRIGKTASVEIAAVAAIPASLLIPIGDRGFVLALVVMAVWFSVNEYAIVSLITLFTELDRAARGTAIGAALGSWSIGHAVGALIGTRIYERAGMGAAAVTMAIAYAACAALTYFGVVDPEPSEVD